MNLNYKKLAKCFLIIIIFFGFVKIYASETAGTIDSGNHTAQICENVSCSVTSTSPINFGYFTTEASKNVTITDNGLRGYIWGSSFGWAVLNCLDADSGCSSANGNFKISVNANGILSGYAWGENAGWINFGPFVNSSTSPITISSSGKFNGYAWSENFGWIKFDCSLGASYCVETDFKPSSYRSSTSSGNIVISPSIPPITPPATPPLTPLTTPPIIVPSVTPPAIPSAIPSTPPPTISSVPETILPPIIINTANNIGNSIVKIFSPGGQFISQIINSPGGDTATKIITSAGIISGATIAVTSVLFVNPLSFSELFLIPMRLWGLLMTAFGFKRRNKPWGTVYDSVTKQPLDPAYITLQSIKGKEVAASITDIDGRYGFLVPAGKYRLSANKTNYRFPSIKLSEKSIDEVYPDLYFGDDVEIATDGAVITKNIPMDPVSFDWNEFEKNQLRLMKFYSQRNLWINRISNFMFNFGFTLTVIAVLAAPKTYNIATFIIYIILLLLKHTILKPRPYGVMVEKSTGNPLSFGIIHVYPSGMENEAVHKVADKMGRFYCLIPNGIYTIKIEKKNSDESYREIYAKGGIEVKEGFINMKFEV